MADDEYREITLADLVSTIYRRKVVLVSVFLVVLLGGIAFTAFSTPQYEAEATVIPLEQSDIIQNFLDSRQAGEVVARQQGDALVSRLFPARWDSGSESWRGEPPTETEAGLKIARSASVSGGQIIEAAREERKITITVSASDPVLARDIANGLLDSLSTLRPTFENITAEQAFAIYYDGDNEQAARQRAEQVAKEKQYWLVLDTATTPESPSSPNVTLNIALSVVLGLMLAVFAVFIVEWASNYRAERRQIEAPPDEGYKFRRE